MYRRVGGDGVSSKNRKKNALIFSAIDRVTELARENEALKAEVAQLRAEVKELHGGRNLFTPTLEELDQRTSHLKRRGRGEQQ